MSEGRDERRERLKALRERAGKVTGEGAKKLKFRNYRPQDAEVKDKITAQVATADTSTEKAASDETTTPSAGHETSHERSPALAESLIQHELKKQKEIQEEDEELNIAPKKVNWDLKRDVDTKLQKLERRTQRAIVEIIRERIEQQTAEDNNDSSTSGDEGSSDGSSGDESSSGSSKIDEDNGDE